MLTGTELAGTSGTSREARLTACRVARFDSARASGRADGNAAAAGSLPLSRSRPLERMLQASALPVPKTSSTQVGAVVGGSGDALVPAAPGWFLPRSSASCGMMIGCAAATGLSERDERVRVTAAACGQRPGQGRGDAGAASPGHGPAAAAGHGPATALPVRPGVPGRLAALAAWDGRAPSAPSGCWCYAWPAGCLPGLLEG